MVNITRGGITLPTSSVSDENVMVFATSTEYIFAPLENALRIFENIIKIIGNDAYCAENRIKNTHNVV